MDDQPAEIDDLVPLEPPDLLSTRIDPLHRLGVAIVVGTALAAPSLLGAVKGSTSLATAAWMFGVSVTVAWLMVWLVWAVWHMYRSQHDQVIWDAYAAAEAARLERVAEMELAARLAEEEAERLAAELAADEAAAAEAAHESGVDAAVDPDELARRESDRLAGETVRLQAELDELVVEVGPGLIAPSPGRGLRPPRRPESLSDAISEAPESTEGLVVPDELTESR
jgi:hypothetical protein